MRRPVVGLSRMGLLVWIGLTACHDAAPARAPASFPPPAVTSHASVGGDAPSAKDPSAAPGWPREAPVVSVITSADALDAAVGQLVTLRGLQTRTKIPSVLGVDVDGPYELSDTEVEVSGRLERFVIEPPADDEPIAAGRGPGIYYKLVDPVTHRLATTRPLRPPSQSE